MLYSARLHSLLLLLFFVSSTCLHAADRERIEDSMSVLVVEVPVYVVRDGEPVRGLTIDNFELVEQRKGQELLGLDIVDLEAEVGPSPVSIGAVGRRHFLFVFDLSFSSPNAIARARQAAQELVETSLHPTDLVAVATYSARTGPQMVLDFTIDRRQVAFSLNTLGLTGRRPGTQDPLGGRPAGPRGIGDVRDAAPPGDAPAGGGRQGINAEAEILELLESISSEQAQVDALRRVRSFASNFGALADSMSNLEGRKHVVFLSEGFDASPLLGTNDQDRIVELNRAAETGEYWNVDSQERFGDTEALGQIYQVMEAFRQADCTIQAVDIGGLSTADDVATKGGSSSRDGLFLMARETGGELFENFNDLGQAMTKMLERSSVTYVLSYQPSRAGQPGDFRKLKVKLKNVPKARVTHRDGYYVPRPFEELSAQQQRAFMAQQMSSGALGGDLRLAALATPIPQTTGPANVPVLLQVMGGDLPTQHQKTLKLEIKGFAFDTEGTLQDQFGERVQLDLRQVGETLRSGGLKFFAQFDLPPGDYALRFLLLDTTTGKSAMQVVPVVVPEAEQFFASPLLLPEQTKNWIIARESVAPPEPAEGETRPQEEGLAETQKPADYPFLFKSQAFVPAVRPNLEPDQLLATSLVAFRTSGEPIEVESRLLDSTGSVVSEDPVRVVDREYDSETAIERMIAATRLPALAPGSYTFVTILTDPATGESLSTTSEITIPEDSTQASAGFAPPEWMPDLSEVLASIPGGPAVDLPKAELRSAYVETLNLLAESKSVQALEALKELDSEVSRNEPAFASLEVLRKLQVSELKRISKTKAHHLLPVLKLHREAYAQYRLINQRLLALHAFQVYVDTVRWYARKDPSDEGLATAADLLTGLASEIYRTGGRGSAHLLLTEALTYDPKNVPALHGLGALQEKSGAFDRALRTFERLVETDPSHEEGRLRLAINQARFERQNEARSLLKGLLAEEPSDWIVSLAYQELARMDFSEEEYDDARKLLERGVARLPGEEKLRLQLAYAYERCQKFPQAQATIDQIEPLANTSARNRYNQSPSLIYPQNTERLETMAAEALPSYKQAIVSAGGQP